LGHSDFPGGIPPIKHNSPGSGVSAPRTSSSVATSSRRRATAILAWFEEELEVPVVELPEGFALVIELGSPSDGQGQPSSYARRSFAATGLVAARKAAANASSYRPR